MVQGAVLSVRKFGLPSRPNRTDFVSGDDNAAMVQVPFKNGAAATEIVSPAMRLRISAPLGAFTIWRPVMTCDLTWSNKMDDTTNNNHDNVKRALIFMVGFSFPLFLFPL
jgi:hypothetical protein